MPGAVLFDLDGVLIDSIEAWYQVMDGAARAFSCAPLARAAFTASFGQSVHADQRQFFPQRTPREIDLYYRTHFMDHAAHLKVEPDARDVLAELHHKGQRTALVTNSPRALAEEILAFAGLRTDVVCGDGDGPLPKPAPDLLLTACARLSVAPKDALMVGDSPYDFEAARAAGIRFAGLGIAGDVTLAKLKDVLDL